MPQLKLNRTMSSAIFPSQNTSSMQWYFAETKRKKRPTALEGFLQSFFFVSFIPRPNLVSLIHNFSIYQTKSMLLLVTENWKDHQVMPEYTSRYQKCIGTFTKKCMVNSLYNKGKTYLTSRTCIYGQKWSLYFRGVKIWWRILGQ